MAYSTAATIKEASLERRDLRMIVVDKLKNYLSLCKYAAVTIQ